MVNRHNLIIYRLVKTSENLLLNLDENMDVVLWEQYLQAYYAFKEIENTKFNDSQAKMIAKWRTLVGQMLNKYYAVRKSAAKELKAIDSALNYGKQPVNKTFDRKIA